MAIIDEKKPATAEFRKYIRVSHNCPICNERVKIGIEQQILDNVKKFPYAHGVIHDHPAFGLHIMVAFIDANMQVRGTEGVQSLEISRTGNTFSLLMKKWSQIF